MVRQSSDAIRGKDQPMLRERRMFRLLLQSNPNYFGNAAFSHFPARSPVILLCHISPPLRRQDSVAACRRRCRS